jgi:hypothetical protein
MSDMLTLAEYKAMAAELSLPTMSFIDGGFRPALSGNTFKTLNPATGELLTNVAVMPTMWILPLAKLANRLTMVAGANFIQLHVKVY